MTRETQVSEEVKKERGYYMPTRITIVYSDEKVIGQEGIPEWLAEAVKGIRKLYPIYDKYATMRTVISQTLIPLVDEHEIPVTPYGHD